MSDTDKTLLETLIERRAAVAAEAQEILDTVEAETRSLTEDEETRSASLTAQMKDLTDRINLQEAVERSRHIAEAAAAKVTITHEPHEYRADNSHEVSFFRDLAAHNGLVGGSNVDQANERLARHAKNILETRAGSATAGAGGDFTAPVWLEAQFAEALRWASPTWDACKQVELQTDGNTFTVPRVATGTQIGVQGTENTDIDNRDIVEDTVTGVVDTVAGFYDVSLKAVERSTNGIFDLVITQDLLAEYVRAKDEYILSFIQGLAEANNVTFTSSSPTAQEFLTAVAQSVSQIATNRKIGNIPTTTIMTPAQWYNLLSEADTTGRPVVASTGLANYNAQGVTPTGIAQGVAGKLAIGSDVILDGNLPSATVSEVSTTPIITAIMSEIWAMETAAGPTLEVFRAPGSATNTLRYRCYGYVSALCRRGESVSIISGTGLANPRLN